MAVKDIKRRDKQALSESAEINFESRESIESNPPPPEDDAAPEVIDRPAAYYLDQYNSIIEATNDMIGLVDLKCNEFSVKFDPKQEVEVANAIRKAFGITTDTITYDMYIQALEELNALAGEIEDTMMDQ